MDERLGRAEALLGHSFADRTLLDVALTHPSYAFENPSAMSYDRLEFLGDAVLSFIVSAYLFGAFPEAEEGELTKRKHFVTCGESLAEAGLRLGVAELLVLGTGADAAGERSRASVLENAMEALVAALYLDAGLERAREFVLRTFEAALESAALPVADAKGALQEWAQSERGMLPVYEILATSGPDHARSFVAEVRVADEVLGQGSGASKQAAEKSAAEAALARLGSSVSVPRGGGDSQPARRSRRRAL